MLGLIENLVLDFILYFVTASMRKYPMLICNISTGHNTKCTIYFLKKEVKNVVSQRVYNRKYAQKMFKTIKMKNDRVNI